MLNVYPFCLQLLDNFLQNLSHYPKTSALSHLAYLKLKISEKNRFLIIWRKIKTQANVRTPQGQRTGPQSPQLIMSL